MTVKAMSSGPYSALIQFEESFNESAFQKYMKERWADSIFYSAVYIAVIFAGRRYMRDRPAYNLRPVRVLWNGALAIFSIAGALRTFPELVSSVSQSWKYSICVIDLNNDFTMRIRFWAAAFAASKVIELGDTLLIILRKQPLIFLHWYHHATVLIYVWYSYTDHTAAGRWFIVMNYVAHSLVYLYYTLAALRIRVPVSFKVAITTTQILQMVIGCTINVYTYQIKGRGEACQQTYRNIVASTIMYFTYFLLFAHFFRSAYFQRSENKQQYKKTQ